MIRQAPRYLLRQQPILRSLQPAARQQFLSTAPPSRTSRSWKSLAVRAGLAVGVVYYYNTSNLFAEEPAYAVPPPQPPTEDSSLPTLNSISPKPKIAALSPAESPTPTSPICPAQQEQTANTSPSLDETEEEAHQQGAFNEETGEINWDCPCLGGMAHGPCGEQFRAAFSCFVYSKEEPKGMDCIEHFKTMQGCFREHPEEYGSELEDEGEEGLEGEGGRVSGVGGEGEGERVGGVGGEGLEGLEIGDGGVRSPAPAATASGTAYTPGESPGWIDDGKVEKTRTAQAARKQVYDQHDKTDERESETLVPKAAFDARELNEGK